MLFFFIPNHSCKVWSMFRCILRNHGICCRLPRRLTWQMQCHNPSQRRQGFWGHVASSQIGLHLLFLSTVNEFTWKWTTNDGFPTLSISTIASLECFWDIYMILRSYTCPRKDMTRNNGDIVRILLVQWRDTVKVIFHDDAEGHRLAEKSTASSPENDQQKYGRCSETSLDWFRNILNGVTMVFPVTYEALL